MHNVVTGWFGLSTLWLGVLVWRLVAARLSRDSDAPEPGMVRIGIGAVCVLLASALLEGGVWAKLAPGDTTDRVGRALLEAFGPGGGIVIGLAGLALGLPWLFGTRWSALMSDLVGNGSHSRHDAPSPRRSSSNSVDQGSRSVEPRWRTGTSNAPVTERRPSSGLRAPGELGTSQRPSAFSTGNGRAAKTSARKTPVNVRHEPELITPESMGLVQRMSSVTSESSALSAVSATASMSPAPVVSSSSMSSSSMSSSSMSASGSAPVSARMPATYRTITLPTESNAPSPSVTASQEESVSSSRMRSAAQVAAAAAARQAAAAALRARASALSSAAAQNSRPGSGLNSSNALNSTATSTNGVSAKDAQGIPDTVSSQTSNHVVSNDAPIVIPSADVIAETFRNVERMAAEWPVLARAGRPVGTTSDAALETRSGPLTDAGDDVADAATSIEAANAVGTVAETAPAIESSIVSESDSAHEISAAAESANHATPSGPIEFDGLSFGVPDIDTHVDTHIDTHAYAQRDAQPYEMVSTTDVPFFSMADDETDDAAVAHPTFARADTPYGVYATVEPTGAPNHVFDALDLEAPEIEPPMFWAPPVAEPVIDLGTFALPALSDGVSNQAIADEPVVVEPVVVEPVVVEPVVVEPVVVEPVVLEPVVLEPVAVESAAVESAAVEPFVAEAAVAEPAVVEPVAVEPIAEPAPIAAEATPTPNAIATHDATDAIAAEQPTERPVSVTPHQPLLPPLDELETLDFATAFPIPSFVTQPTTLPVVDPVRAATAVSVSLAASDAPTAFGAPGTIGVSSVSVNSANAAAPRAVAPPLPPGQQATEFEFHPPSASDVELPGIELLAETADPVEPASEALLAETGQLIEQRLKEFKVPVTVVGASAGPVITRFEVEPALGVRGAQIVGLMKDLSRGLGLTSIRVVETIPGKTCMGLELPNPKRQMIRLSEILKDDAYQKSTSHLTIAMGKDITGQPVVTDLARAPHMLVAGTTGSGKSVAINAMILSLLYKAAPADVRLIMIDPKMLELSVYEGIPHLLAPVVTDMKLAANALNWCVGEMEKRYRLMSALGVRNIAGFNQKIRDAERNERKIGNPFSLTPDAPEPLSPLPLIVVIIDELADLMMVAGKKIEELIARLAQKARASGIHLILATQRPSVDVITGLIKANIPTRVAFQVSSKIDSRTILDQMGAESLLGQGDMLFLPPGSGDPQRIHGAFVADDEVHRVVEHLKQFGEPEYEAAILDPGPAEGVVTDLFGEVTDPEADPLYDEAVAFVVRTRRASISSVQRQLRIGYNRAARLVEQMEAAGLVSSMGVNGSREVLAPGPAD